MKTRRRIFWLILFAAFLAARYTGLRILYVLVFAQLLLYAIVLIVDVWTVFAFRYLQTVEGEKAVKGGRVKVSVKITNETVIPLSLMEVSVALACPGKEQVIPLCVPPFSETDFDVDVDLPYRGVYEIGMKEIRVTDVFGLTGLRFDMKRLPWYRPHLLTVVPRSPAAVSAGEIFDEKLFGDTGIAPAASGDSVTTARPYTEGDALKRVNWKVSARYGQLFVKQYDSPARENVLVLLDNGGGERNGEKGMLFRKKEKSGESLERLAADADMVCECAVAVSRMSLMRGRLSQLCALDPMGKADSISASDEMRMESMLLWLARLDFDQKGNICDLLPALVGQGTSLVVISAGADQELLTELEKYTSAFESVGLIAIGDRIPEKSGNVSIKAIPAGTDVFALFAEEVKRV